MMGFPFLIGFGSLVRQELVSEKKFGKISQFALFLAEIPTQIRNLTLSNDLEVKDRFPSLDGFKGKFNLQESYLLLSRYDGNLKEGIVELVDLKNFEVIHTWNVDINKFNDLVGYENEFKNLRRDGNNARSTYHHPQLLEDGSLIFHNNSPIRIIDACSNLVTQYTNDMYHHSIEVDIKGNFWTSSFLYPQTLSANKIGRDIVSEGGYRDDAIVYLSPNGKIIYEKSISEIFIENNLEYLLFAVGDMNFNNDPIHINDIQPVDIKSKFWEKGDLFLSLRHQSMILLYRPSTNKILWKGTGPFFHQHDVNILDDHRISIFNNNSKNFVDGDKVDGHNNVIIYDFKEKKYTTYLEKSLIDNEVRTITVGKSQILNNGDLFVEETNYGRSLYFNSDGSLRWTHLNRADNGKVYLVNKSRILFTKKDLENVKNFLKYRDNCYK